MISVVGASHTRRRRKKGADEGKKKEKRGFGSLDGGCFTWNRGWGAGQTVYKNRGWGSKK